MPVAQALAHVLDGAIALQPEQVPLLHAAGRTLAQKLGLKAGATIKVFNENDRKVHRRFITDAEGRARIELPVRDRYLLGAVHMLAPTPAEQKKADWTSLWASLTFMRP